MRIENNYLKHERGHQGLRTAGTWRVSQKVLPQVSFHSRRRRHQCWGFLVHGYHKSVQVRIGLSYRPHRPCIARPPDRQQHFHVIFRKHTKHVVLCIFSCFSWLFKMFVVSLQKICNVLTIIALIIDNRTNLIKLRNMRKITLSILAMLFLTVSTAWADDFTVERAVNLGQLDS